MIVTLEEYNNAIQIIKSFHEQINSEIKYMQNRTKFIKPDNYTVADLYREHKGQMSVRLKNGLATYIEYNPEQLATELCMSDVIKYRMFGKQSVDELIALLTLLNLKYSK